MCVGGAIAQSFKVTDKGRGCYPNSLVKRALDNLKKQESLEVIKKATVVGAFPRPRHAHPTPAPPHTARPRSPDARTGTWVI